ncbi:MAG: hypothetical protein JEY91_02310, partial [Spirochaetaceae bacterium]|nr:hypothetical protein [Spirochaetaceae bacterium]
IDSFIASGAFIVSPGWLENWKNHPRKKDLIGAQKNLKFSDSIKKIVLFDTGVSDDSKDHLRSLASHLSRPYEVLAVNIEYFQGYLKSLFKIGKEKKSPNKLIPICSECHKIRDEKGVWHQEVNTRETHAHREYTHGLCRDCADKIYGQKEWYRRNKQREKE